MDACVSVILPSLNVSQYIRECLGSVVGQTLREIEIICVDAGSTDGTLEIINSFMERDSRIRLIHSDRKSYGYQMNLGIDAAQGEYVGIVETDDYVLPEMYETLYQAAREQDVEVVSSDFYYFVDREGQRRKTCYQIMADAWKYGRVLDPCSEERPCFSVPIFTWTAIYRRSFLEKHRVRYHETAGAAYQDNGFFFQVYTHARRWYAVPQAFYMLRRDNAGSSVFQTSNLVRMLDEYHFIKEVLEAEGLFFRFRHEYAYRYIDSCIWVLDNLAYRDMEGFLTNFREGLRELFELGTFRYTDYDDHRLAVLFKILHGLELYVKKEIAPRRELYEKLGKYERIIIYGAGAIGKMFLDEARVNVPNSHIIGFAVSRKEDSDGEWHGAKVYPIRELESYRDNCAVVVATKKAYHADIKKILDKMSFYNVFFLSWSSSLGGTYRKQFWEI